MMKFNYIKLKDIMKESKIIAEPPNPYRRLTVRLNCNGVEKRAFVEEKESGTRYYIRKKGQFIYGKQNLDKGAFGVIPDDLDGYESSGDLPAFDVNTKLCDPKWIVLWLKNNNYYKNLSSIAKGSATRRIYPEDFLELEMPLPPINYQKYFINYYESVEKTIIGINDRLKEVELFIKKLRDEILQEAIQGKLVPQDPNDEPARVLLEKIKAEKERLIKEGKIKKEKPLPPITEDEVPFELSKGWEWVRLGEIVFIGENKNIHKELDLNIIVNYVDIDCIDNKKYKIKEIKRKYVKELSSRARRVLRKDFILYSLVRPYLNNIAIINEDKDNFIGSTGFVVFKPIIVDIKYIFYFLISPYIRNYYLDLMKGFNSPSINMEEFITTFIPLPPLNEQKRIVEKLDQLMTLCDELEAEIEKSKKDAEKLMQAVLQEAFKGTNNIYPLT